jgi:hypothetical protein
VRLRIRPRSYSILPAALLLFRKLPRLRIRRARRSIAFPRRYSIAGPPVGFIAQKRMLRPKIKRARLRLRPRLFPFLPLLAILYRKLPRLKLKRTRRFVRFPRLYSIAGPPATFIAARRMLRPRIRRARRIILGRRAVILPGGPLLFRKTIRLRFKRGRRFILPRRYSIAGPPASVIPHKRFPRARIKKGKWDLRRFTRRFYEFPGVATLTRVWSYISSSYIQ